MGQLSVGRPAALVVSDVFPPAIGGSGTLLFNAYQGMVDVPVSVLTTRLQGGESAVDDGRLAVFRESPPATAWGVLSPAGIRHHLARAARVRQMCASKPTVVHCARLLPEGLSAWLSGRLPYMPYLCWAHGEELAFMRSSRELSFLMKYVLGRASALIANSRSTAEMLQAVGARPSSIEIVYPGVDPDRFRPDVPGASELRASIAREGEVLLLTVGRLQRRKGHDLVVEALAGWPASAPPIRYVIVGDGDERTRLERLAADLHVADRVLFVGAATSEQLPTYYAAADVFVHPNRIDGRDVEGFGIVFLEAAAAGLPVIAGTTGGAPEAVAPGETALMVSGTEADELRRALLQLVAAPALRRRLGEAGRARVLRDFTWARASARVGEVHERAWQSSRRGTKG